MLRKIVEGSARNPLLVALGMAGLVAWGIFAVANTPLDAIPDLSDVQVIVFTEFPGQAPQVVEDQVTYPLSTAMLAVPYAKVVRGYSFFGVSFVYIIFEDGTDLYWARSRVLESLNFASTRLPNGISPTLGPDATGVGWIFEYAVVDRTGNHDLAELRSIQDWHLRYELQTVPGSLRSRERWRPRSAIPGRGRSESAGRLRALARPCPPCDSTRSNSDIGGQAPRAGRDGVHGARPRLYRFHRRTSRQIAVGGNSEGTPVLLRNIATISLGPELRRGLTDLDGEGEAAAGIVIMRSGENALETIQRVKAKLAELSKKPAGRGRDRSRLRSSAPHRARRRQPAGEALGARADRRVGLLCFPRPPAKRARSRSFCFRWAFSSPSS